MKVKLYGGSMYNVFFYSMMFGFTGMAFMSQGWKGKVIGACLWVVNALIFYKKGG